MSAEQQDHPGGSSPESANGGSAPSDIIPSKEPAEKQGTQAKAEIHKFFQRSQELIKDPKTWLEIAALVVLIFFTHYAGQQSKTMNDTLTEIRKQTGYSAKSARGATDAATAARDAVDVSRQNFINDQRPWISLNEVTLEPNTAHDSAGHFAVGQRMYWRIYYSNYGRTHAIDFIGNALLFYGAKAMVEADAYFRHLPTILVGPKDILPPGGPPAPQPMQQGLPATQIGQGFTSVFSSKPLTAEDIAYMYSHDFAIVIVGRFQYRDTSGAALYWTDFCRSTFITGAINSCVKHNEIH